MTDLPERFSCKLTTWEYVYGLCREVTDEAGAADFEPEVVVALARGN